VDFVARAHELAKDVERVDAELQRLEKNLELQLAHVRAARAGLRGAGIEARSREADEATDLHPNGRTRVDRMVLMILGTQQSPMTALEISGVARIAHGWKGGIGSLHTVISRMVARGELKAWGIARSRRYGLRHWPDNKITESSAVPPDESDEVRALAAR
jgi:hypothetical protein